MEDWGKVGQTGDLEDKLGLRGFTGGTGGLENILEFKGHTGGLKRQYFGLLCGLRRHVRNS